MGASFTAGGFATARNASEVDVIQFHESGRVLWQLFALSVSQAESIVRIPPRSNNVKL